jgi:hypothetical protein
MAGSYTPLDQSLPLPATKNYLHPYTFQDIPGGWGVFKDLFAAVPGVRLDGDSGIQINQLGQVVGTEYIPLNTRVPVLSGWLYQNGRVTFLSPKTPWKPTNLNNTGHVCGTAEITTYGPGFPPSQTAPEAVDWVGGTLISLKHPAKPFFSDPIAITIPNSLNDSGQIVGEEDDVYIPSFQAVIWEGEQYYHLSQLVNSITPNRAVVFMKAVAINRKGQILVVGDFASATSFNIYKRQTWLLTPIPAE